MERSLVLVPTYNERENLPLLLERLGRLRGLDVLVIDDSSPDGTGAHAEALRSRYASLSVLHRRRKEGLGRAYAHGFREAIARGYRRIVTMDADLSHAPEDVPRLLEALEKADVAIGSRRIRGGGTEGWPLSRELLSAGGSIYSRTLLGLRPRDVTSGFRAYRVEPLKEIDLGRLQSKGFFFQVEILWRILSAPGRRALEVPILFQNRREGQSKISAGVVAEAALEVLRLCVRQRFLRARGRERPAEVATSDLPRITVVVPARPGTPRPEALRGLECVDYPREKLEVIVARGTSPSRERNEAVRESRGEHILFLDDDSMASPDLISIYADLLTRHPGVAAVGGPTEPLKEDPRGAPGARDLAALVLSEPWAVGKSASRYRARGKLRRTDERELIGCNLCVRREAFERSDGFDERLYPNEENELLERLRQEGWQLLYEPRAVVRRPHRETVGKFLSSIFRYGAGRGMQLRCLVSAVSSGRLLAVLAVLGAVLIGGWGVARGSIVGAGAASLYLLYLLALSARLVWRGGLRRGLGATFLAVALHPAYLTGMLVGLLRRPRPLEGGAVTLSRHELGARFPEGQEAKKRRARVRRGSCPSENGTLSTIPLERQTAG